MRRDRRVAARHAKPPAAVALVIVGLYGVARLPDRLAERSARDVAGRFALQPPRRCRRAARPRRTSSVRAVHPSLAHISAWISSVGAARRAGRPRRRRAAQRPAAWSTRAPTASSSRRCPAPATRYRAVRARSGAAPLRRRDRWRRWAACPATSTRTAAMDLLVYYWGRTPIVFLRKRAGPAAPSRRRYRAGRGRAGRRALVHQRGDAAPISTATATSTSSSATTSRTARGSSTRSAGGPSHDAATRCPGRSTAAEARSCCGGGADGGEPPAVRFREARRRCSTTTIAHGWTLAVGAADLDGDLLPGALPRQRLRPRPPAAQPLDARPPRASRCSRGASTSRRPRSKVLGRDSFKGMGVDFGDLNGDGLPRHLRQQHRRASTRCEESHFVVRRAPATATRCSAASRPTSTAARRSACRGAAGAGTPSWPTSTTTACSKPCRRSASSRATSTAGRSCRSWRWATTSSSRDPRVWPRFEPGDDLSGHQHDPFFVRGRDGRFVDVAPRARARPSRWSAAASRWPTSTATATSTSPSPTSGSPRLLPQRRARDAAPSSGCTCGSRSRRRAGHDRGPRRPPGGRRRRAGPRSAPWPRCTCPTAGASSRRSTAATATPASAAPTSTSAWATGRRRRRLRGRRCAGATPGGARARGRRSSSTPGLAHGPARWPMAGSRQGGATDDRDWTPQTVPPGGAAAVRRRHHRPQRPRAHRSSASSSRGRSPSWRWPRPTPSSSLLEAIDAWAARPAAARSPGGAAAARRLPAAGAHHRPGRARCCSTPTSACCPIAFAAAVAIGSKALFRVPRRRRRRGTSSTRRTSASPCTLLLFPWVGDRAAVPVHRERLPASGDWVMPADHRQRGHDSSTRASPRGCR